MSSLPTFIMRPIVPQCGFAFNFAASIRSLRPSKSPVSFGPRIALPPLSAIKSKPSLKYSAMRPTGGTSAAASISVGISCSRASSTHCLRSILPSATAMFMKNIRRRSLADGPLEIGKRFDIDQLHADVGELVVVTAMVRLLQDHFILQPVVSGNVAISLRSPRVTAAAHAEQHRPRGPRGHESRLDAEQLRDSFADLVLQHDRSTKCFAASAQAATTSGGITDPPSAVNVPAALMTGLMPSDS